MKLLLFGSHFQTLFAEYLVPTYSIPIYTLERLGVRQVFNIATLTARCVQVYIYTHMIDHVCAEINSRRQTKQFTHATAVCVTYLLQPAYPVFYRASLVGLVLHLVLVINYFKL